MQIKLAHKFNSILEGESLLSDRIHKKKKSAGVSTSNVIEAKQRADSKDFTKWRKVQTKTITL